MYILSSVGCVNIVMQMSIPTTYVCDGFTPSSNEHRTKHTYKTYFCKYWIGEQSIIITADKA